MWVLPAEDGVNPHDVPLPLQRLEIVRDRQQVRFGRELVGRVAPVAVRERPKLPRTDECLHPVLDGLEIRRARIFPVAQGLLELRCPGGVRSRGRNDIDPVQGVQMVEVHHVVVDELRARDHVPDEPRVRRDNDLQRRLNGANRRKRMNRRADATCALCEHPGIAWIPALDNRLQAAKHRTRAPGVLDLAILNFHLNAEVAFDSSDRVDCDACHSGSFDSPLSAGGTWGPLLADFIRRFRSAKAAPAAPATATAAPAPMPTTKPLEPSPPLGSLTAPPGVVAVASAPPGCGVVRIGVLGTGVW